MSLQRKQPTSLVKQTLPLGMTATPKSMMKHANAVPVLDLEMRLQHPHTANPLWTPY